MPRLLSVAALLIGAAASLAAYAGDVKVFRNAETVDPTEVAQILDRSAPIKMRSLRLLDDRSSGALAATSAAAAAAASNAARPSALSLPVPFAFDSADILPAAKPQLDAIAAGIRMLPAEQKVVIEGHTDSVGAEEYNDELSQRRAQSVRRYLVATHGIEAARLEAVGFGKHQPLPGRSPLAGENRRVQFRGE
jgi:outer membrane protein OmpA-like peptidoglycan-associated protein